MPTTIVYARPPARVRRRKAPQVARSIPSIIVSARKPSAPPPPIEPSEPYDLEARVEAAEWVWQRLKAGSYDALIWFLLRSRHRHTVRHARRSRPTPPRHPR